MAYPLFFGDLHSQRKNEGIYAKTHNTITECAACQPRDGDDDHLWHLGAEICALGPIESKSNFSL